MSISTHILDTSLGRPAAGVQVTLEQLRGNEWQAVGSGVTDADGRARTLLAADTPLTRGTYRLRFEVAPYFAAQGVSSFYPSVEIAFTVAGPAEHYHVPLLLSPFGYSTYRGT
jgi:5-hydroxyisourate hydrolase